MLTTAEALKSRDIWCPFLLFPDLQGLLMVVITLMTLMTVIMLMGEVVKTAKMKNLIFEMGPFKLSFLPFSFFPFLRWQ